MNDGAGFVFLWNMIVRSLDPPDVVGRTGISEASRSFPTFEFCVVDWYLPESVCAPFSGGIEFALSTSATSLRLDFRNLKDFDLVSIPGIFGFEFVSGYQGGKLKVKKRRESNVRSEKEWTARKSQRLNGQRHSRRRLKGRRAAKLQDLRKYHSSTAGKTSLAPASTPLVLIIPATIIHPQLRVRDKLHKVENPLRGQGRVVSTR
jgi:hypothetical protein